MACQGQTQVCSNLCPQDTVMESSEYQLRSLINGVQSNLDLSGLLTVEEMDNLNNINDHILDGTHQLSMKEDCIRESLSKRYCNGIMGIPITFLDKWNPEQFEIIELGNSRDNFTPNKDYVNPQKHKKDGCIVSGGAINCVLAMAYKEKPVNIVYYTSDNSNFLVPPYARILICRKVSI